MRLYFSPGACSLAPHIVIRELGLDVELEGVNLGTKATRSGGDYRDANPKGYVPALLLDDGELLTEAAVLVQYLSDLKPEAGLLPPAGTRERYRAMEWLNFIATEVHKGFSPLFNTQCPDEWKTQVRATLGVRFDLLSERLKDRPFLLGQTFSAADAYLFTVLGWTRYTGLDLEQWPVLKAYREGIGERPSVRAAFEAEKAAR